MSEETSGELQKPDQPQDLLSVSMRFALVIVFQSSRSPSYPMAVALARNASFYDETKHGNTTHHAAGFGGNEEQFARAATIARLVGSLKGTFMIVKGRIPSSGDGALSVIECCLKSYKVNDYRAHCNLLFPSQMPPGMAGSHIKIEGIPKGEQALIPCSYAASFSGWAITPSHPSKMSDQFLAVCVKRGCDWCPRCIPEDFRFVPS